MLTNQPSLFANLTAIDSGIVLSSTATDEQIKRFILTWQEQTSFALDLETYGKGENDPLDPWLGHIRTVQIGLKNGSVLVADLGGWDDDRSANHDRLTRLGFFDTLKTTVESPTIWTVMHNGLFELCWLGHKYGIKAWHCADTMLLSQLLWAGIEAYRHSLKAVGERLGISIDKEQQRSDWGWPLSNEQINYAANDVRVLFPIWRKLAAEVDLAGMNLSASIEFNALPAFAEMTIGGFPVDRQILDRITDAYEQAAAALLEPFAAAFPDLSVDDHAKLPGAIKQKLGIEVSKSDKSALNPYRDRPEISSLLAGRSIGAYLDYLYNMKRAYRDGAVRGGYRQQAKQGRGRSTSGGGNGIPSCNLQNPPNPTKACPELAALNLPKVRSAFRPPVGYKLLVVDLSAAHARIAAQTTGDELFIASYIDNVDVHAIVASRLSTLPTVAKNWTQEQISKIRKQEDENGRKTPDAVLATSLRNVSKNVFYGWLNGAGASKTSETIRVGGFENSIEFAESIVALLGESFPGIRAYHDRVKRHLKTNQVRHSGVSLSYTWATGVSGRRVWLPVWENPKTGRDGKPYIAKSAKPTDAVMAAWMMVEADAVKAAMHVIRTEAANHPEWDLQFVNICHDELDCICKAEYADAAAHAVWLAMQGCLAMFVQVIPVVEDPFKASSIVCDDWSEK